MSILVDGVTISVVHVRHDGRSHGIYTDDISGVGMDITSAQLLSAVEDHLDLPEGELGGYEVDMVLETENVILRPQAKFGR